MKRAAVLVLLLAHAALAQKTFAQIPLAQEPSAADSRRGQAATQESETIANLDRCFAATRTASAICESSTAGSAERVACLNKVLLAQQDCLDHVRVGGRLPPPAHVDRSAPAGRKQSASRRSAPETVPSMAPPSTAPPAPTGRQQAPLRDGTEADREPETGALPPSSPLAAPLPPPSAETTAWTMSETTSPIDYSPVVLAALAPLASSGAKPPSELVVGCRGMRIEFALRTGQTWIPTSGGTVEIAIAPEGQPTRRGRWILSPSGRSAVPDQDASEILRDLPSVRTLVSVADGSGRAAGVFDLASLDPVRDRVWQTCHSPAATRVESSPAPSARHARTSEKRASRAGAH